MSNTSNAGSGSSEELLRVRLTASARYVLQSFPQDESLREIKNASGKLLYTGRVQSTGAGFAAS
jgi:hypothetical protein